VTAILHGDGGDSAALPLESGCWWAPGFAPGSTTYCYMYAPDLGTLQVGRRE
jgi:hypothetical protein